jgi:FkbM family methyltransferase
MARGRFAARLRRDQAAPAAPPEVGAEAVASALPDDDAHPVVLVRVGTSDPDVYMQIFGALEYGPLPQSVAPGLIVDCGANVGYASVSFLERYPGSELIAIEPDPGNASMARRNLAAYGERAIVIQAGVWSHTTPLRVRRGAFGDGREWSFQVEEVPPGEAPDVDGIGLDDVFAGRPVDLLKIDIERGELELFRGPCPWLALVRNIAIELHDDDCADALHDALAGYDYEEFSAGEVTFCCDIRARAPF